MAQAWELKVPSKALHTNVTWIPILGEHTHVSIRSKPLKKKVLPKKPSDGDMECAATFVTSLHNMGLLPPSMLQG